MGGVGVLGIFVYIFPCLRNLKKLKKIKMKSYKDQLTRPPLTQLEARTLAQNTLTRLEVAEANLLRLEKVLNYAYSFATPEEKEEMERLLSETDK